MNSSVTAFAPATCGNVCVGFDTLGLCYSGVGDTITVNKIADKKVAINSITGVAQNLPLEAEKNTAGIVLIKLIESLQLSHGFEINIEKGIHTGSGMGGSAASSIGALYAANQLLDAPLAKIDLLKLAYYGEELVSGTGHYDNLAPCLYGGLVLIKDDNLNVISIPFPEDLTLLLVHPQIKVETKKARQVLKDAYPLKDITQQLMNLSGFIAGCFKNDKELIKASYYDFIAEPYRTELTKFYRESKELTANFDIIGHSLSGSGPSQLIICRQEKQAQEIEQLINNLYHSHNIATDSYIGPINNEGCKLI